MCQPLKAIITTVSSKVLGKDFPNKIHAEHNKDSKVWASDGRLRSINSQVKRQ